MGIYCPGLTGALLALTADAAGPEVLVSHSGVQLGKNSDAAFHCFHKPQEIFCMREKLS